MRPASRTAATFAAAAIISSLTACAAAPDRSTLSPETETALLARETGAIRPVEARLSGFDQWAAWSGAHQISERAKSSVLNSRLLIQQKHAGTDDARWYAALGVRHLLVGEVPQAISLLESSRVMEGDRAQRLNDLAAACVAQVSITGNVAQLAYALDLAEAAARENPKLPAARFNRALILEQLGPPSRAALAWRDYLAFDSSSSWASEAVVRLNRLDALVRQKAAAGAALSRSSVEAQLLTWAKAAASGDEAGAAAALTLAETGAKELRNRDKNTYPLGVVDDLHRHERAGRAKQFALAYVAAAEAAELSDSNETAAAATRFTHAISLTLPEGAFWYYLTYRQLHASWFQGDMKAQERRVRTLIEGAEANGLQLVASRSRVVLGSILQKLAQFSAAVEAYQQAIAGLVTINEYGHVASARTLLAAALREHALWQQAWLLESQALADYDLLTQDSQRHLVLLEATRLAIARQQTDLAARFQGFLAAQAVESRSAGAAGIAAANAARVHLQRGQFAEASAELERAEQTLDQEKDEKFRNSYKLEMLTLRTEVQIKTAPPLALESARTLVRSLGPGEALFRRVRAQWLLGKAAMAANEPDEAITAWRAGIAALETDNQTAREEQLRIARTSDVWAIYEDLTTLLVNRGKTQDALEISERGRARALVYSMAKPLQPTTIDASLGRDATVIYYALVGDRMLVWVLDGKTITFQPVDGGAARVNGLSNELRALSASNGDPTPVLRRLHAALIAPVATKIQGRERLVIVPDGAMSVVPFAALVSPGTGRLILEEHEVQIAPSLTMLRHGLDQRDRATRPDRVLTVGAAESEGLAALPGARHEVQQIAALYSQTALLDNTLTVSRFLDAVKQSDVVHFAGHAVENREFPSRSFLAMGGSQRLTPDGIHTSDFGHVRLLVLSACSTAEGAIERGEGVLSLARPFLGAGVRQVLATVSAVDDSLAPRVLVAFHEKLRSGATPAAALRSAQLDAYTPDRRISLRGWAAFEIFGVTASR